MRRYGSGMSSTVDSNVRDGNGFGGNGEEIFVMDITVPCIFCKHFNRDERENMTCAAYPNGIPKEIQDLKVIHTKPYSADNGIKYEPLSDKHDYFKYFKGEILQ